MTHDSRTRWILGLASLASLMVALDTLVVSTALSTIRLDLGAPLEQLEWTVNAYNLSLAVLLITAAGLGDRFGGGACSRGAWACSWPPPRPAACPARWVS